MRYTNVFIALLFTFSLFCSCQSESDTKGIISRLLYSEIHFPVAGMQQHDSFNEWDNVVDTMTKPRYNLIVYFDSLECMSCTVGKMHSWDKLMNHIDSFYYDTHVSFIFSPKKSEIGNLKLSLELTKMYNNIYIDTCGSFIRENNFIPPEVMYHTFLVDSMSKVIMVGDPRRTEKLMSLFFKQIDNAKKSNL